MRYTYKLRCPKCNSLDCSQVDEIIYLKTTKTNKDGSLSKRSTTQPTHSNGCAWFVCNKCGHEETSDTEGDSFVFDERWVDL